MHIIGDVNMKRENNKKFKKRKRNQNRSLTCRVLSMMFAIVLFCSTVLINTDYVSQASSFDDMVDMVEVEEDSAAADTSEDTGDDLDTDVNFEFGIGRGLRPKHTANPMISVPAMPTSHQARTCSQMEHPRAALQLKKQHSL